MSLNTPLTVPSIPSEDTTSLQSSMGPIPKKSVSTLSPTCRNILEKCTDASLLLNRSLAEFSTSSIMTELLNQQREINLGIKQLLDILANKGADGLNCVFCRKSNHLSVHCYLNTERKYQLLTDRQLCARCLRPYSDPEHSVPCDAKCDECNQGHHLFLHPKLEKVPMPRHTKRFRQNNGSRHQPN